MSTRGNRRRSSWSFAIRASGRMCRILDQCAEMLLQHILTKDIFLRSLRLTSSTGRTIYRVLATRYAERTFFTGDTRYQAIRRLRAYYGAITKAATGIADYVGEAEFPEGDIRGLLQGVQPRGGLTLGLSIRRTRLWTSSSGGRTACWVSISGDHLRTRMCRYWTRRRGRGRSSRT